MTAKLLRPVMTNARILSFVLFAALLCVRPNPAEAGLKEAMNSMFISTSTDPQVYNSQRLMGVYGGSISLRSPGSSISVLQISPPRIDAGCGGIDMTFGSFSFINGAQFEQLIRSIAANATGFAIKAAIKGMCAPCAEIIDSLSDAMNSLNAMAKNTCAIATAMYSGNLEDKLKEQASRFGQAMSNVTNRASDWYSSNSRAQTQTSTETATGGSPNGKDMNPMLGNIVYKAAKQTMQSGANTLRAFMTERDAIQMVMGLFGTNVMRAKDDGAKCDDGASDIGCDLPSLPFTKTITVWDQVFNPRGTTAGGLQVYECLNETDGCDKIQPRTIPYSEWGGVQDTINNALYGTTTPESRSTWTDNSIIGSFANKRPLGNGNQLDARSQQILNLSPFPIMPYLLEVQKIPGAAEQIGVILGQFLPRYFSYQLGIELLSTGNAAFNAQTKANMPESYANELNSKAQMLMKYKPDPAEASNMLKGIYDSVVINQRITSSKLRGATSRERE